MSIRRKTWRDVVYDVVKKNNRPMHFLEITNESTKIKTNFRGKTPERTIISEVGREIRGDIPGDRFTSLGEGYYGLKEWEEEDSESEKIVESSSDILEPIKREFQPLMEIRKIVSKALKESEVHKRILDDLLDDDPYDFEQLIDKLFENMGYITHLTSKSRDHGIDVILRRDDGVLEQKTIVQVKRRKDPIGEEYVKTLHSTLVTNPTATQAILLTTSSFTTSAIDYVIKNKLPIMLMDGRKVVDLMLKYGY